MAIDPNKLFFFFVLLFAISIHEASHAWMAEKCGDPTAASLGRITLNPIPHIDIFGTIIIPLFMIFFSPSFGLIGWGKPCPVNPLNFRKIRRDDILVSLAGVTSNLIVGISSLLLLKFFLIIGIRFGGLIMLLRIMFIINLELLIFNLLPIPPLDGSHVLREILPDNMADQLDFLDRWGFVILIILINTPFFDAIFYRFFSLLERIFWFVIRF